MTVLNRRLSAAFVGFLVSSGAVAATNSPRGPISVGKPNPQMQRERMDSRSARKNEKFSKKRVANSKEKAKAMAAKRDAISASASSTTSSSVMAPSPGLNTGTSAAPLGKVSKRPTFVDNLRASVLFEYYGSSLTDPFSGFQPDRNTGYGIGSDKVWLLTRATAGYAISPNITVSANGYFLNHGSSVNPATGMQNGDASSFVFRPDMSFLRLNFGKFAQLGNVKWSGDFRVYPGLGAGSHGQPIYLRTGQNFFLPLNDQWTLAAYNTLRYFHRTSAHYQDRARQIAAQGERPSMARIDYLATVGPAIEYQALDSLGVSFSYNYTLAHDHLQNTFAEGGELGGVFWQSYFELGFSWDISKRINFNPYVDWLMQTPNVEAAQLGANLNISFL